MTDQSVKTSKTIDLAKKLMDVKDFSNHIREYGIESELVNQWLKQKCLNNELGSLPPVLAIQNNGVHINLLLANTKEQLDAFAGLLTPPVVYCKDKLDPAQLIDNLIISQYKKYNLVGTELRKLLKAYIYPSAECPILREISHDDHWVKMSFVDEECFTMPDVHYAAQYLNSSYEDNGGEYYDRKSLNERMEGPSHSSDEMFQEVGKSLQEAIQEVKEPVLGEFIEGGLNEDGLYTVRTMRQFKTREEYLDYMRKVMEI